jgi:hypothetical protein
VENKVTILPTPTLQMMQAAITANLDRMAEGLQGKPVAGC